MQVGVFAARASAARHIGFYGPQRGTARPADDHFKRRDMKHPERPPRTSEDQIEQPDSAGKWWFVGNVLFAGSNTLGPTIVEINGPRLYCVVQLGDKLLICEVDDDEPYVDAITWVGWWRKQEEERYTKL
jgi:hypothetical protein